MADRDETPARPVPGHPRTAIEASHTSVIGETHAPNDLRGVLGSREIHSNRQGMDFRKGNPPPDYLKWYTGQGGETGTQSGTPFATHQPGEQRPPDQSPPVGWEPGATNATDANIAGGDGRRDRLDTQAEREAEKQAEAQADTRRAETPATETPSPRTHGTSRG